MWFADIVLDLAWFADRRGKLGDCRSRASQKVAEPELETEILLYGDDYIIRHLRVLMHTDQKEVADACINRNIQAWVNTLGVASSLATAAFSTVAHPQKNSVSFMVLQGEGDANSESVVLELQQGVLQKADYGSAAKLMVGWKPEFRTHLHFLQRFLNPELPPEVRWLNGYRAIEWHFCEGTTDLERRPAYLSWLETHGAGFDPFLRPGQKRKNLIVEIRGSAAHAVVSGDQGDLVVKTFPAMEALIAALMNEGAGDGISFHPTAVKPIDVG
jgi:hypothetical protein